MRVHRVVTRRFHDEGSDHQRNASIMVSVVAIPGIEISKDRPETVPTARVIRSAKPAAALNGAAALSVMDRRITEIARAIIAARSGTVGEVTI